MIEDSDLLFSTKSFEYKEYKITIWDDGTLSFDDEGRICIHADDLQYLASQAKLFRDRRYNYKKANSK